MVGGYSRSVAASACLRLRATAWVLRPVSVRCGFLRLGSAPTGVSVHVGWAVVCVVVCAGFVCRSLGGVAAV
jgi:uncharacterized protein (DUF2237 family)